MAAEPGSQCLSYLVILLLWHMGYTNLCIIIIKILILIIIVIIIIKKPHCRFKVANWGEKRWHAGIFCLFGFSCSHTTPYECHSGKLILYNFRSSSQWSSSHLEHVLPSFGKLLPEKVGQYCYIRNLRGSYESMQQQYRQGENKRCRCCSCWRLTKCHINFFFRSPIVRWSHQSGGKMPSGIQHVSSSPLPIPACVEVCMALHAKDWAESHPPCYAQRHKMECNKEGSATSFQGASGYVMRNAKRPDSTTLIPWARGKPMAWNVTVPDTYA